MKEIIFEQTNDSKDIMMDLNIPFQFYIIFILIIIIVITIKYFCSSEEIFEFIEKSKKNSLKSFSDEEDKLDLLTKFNTKINRDYLDNSKYYNEEGYNRIYGNKNAKNNDNDKSKNKNDDKIYIKKNKKVCFSDDIIYEYDN